MSPALHVFRAVLGLASIKDPAACPVLHLVSAFRATSAAPKISPVDINVLVFVVKRALKATVTYVPVKLMLEWIFSK